MKQQDSLIWLQPLQVINTSILLLPVICLAIIFLGISFSSSYESYDSWRILQLSVIGISLLFSAGLTGCSFGGFAKGNFLLSAAYIKSKTLLLVFLLLLLTATSIFVSEHTYFALLDALFYLLLITYMYLLVKVFSEANSGLVKQLLAVTAILPFYVIIWFVIGYVLYWWHDIPLVWHGLFTNIRYYDDTLLPCLFLLWYQPGFLRHRHKLVVFIASFYLLTLWVDAARAVWLSILVGLVLSIVLNPKAFKKLKVVFASLLLSIVLYTPILMINTLVSSNVSDLGYHVLRAGSSGRLDMWLASVDVWRQHWLFGIGGANFVFLEREVNSQNLGHIHNLALQLVLEWGLLGLCVLLLAVHLFYRLIKLHASTLPVVLLAGMVAIVFNTLLSGMHIYPSSQMAMVFFLAYILSLINKKTQLKLDNSNRVLALTHLATMCFVFCLVCLLSLVLPSRQGLQPLEQSHGPRFWSNSYSVGLPKEIKPESDYSVISKSAY